MILVPIQIFHQSLDFAFVQFLERKQKEIIIIIRLYRLGKGLGRAGVGRIKRLVLMVLEKKNPYFCFRPLTGPMVSSFWISSFSSLLLRVFLLPSLPEYLWKTATKVQRAVSTGQDMIRTRNRERDLAGREKDKIESFFLVVFFSVRFFFF